MTAINEVFHHPDAILDFNFLNRNTGLRTLTVRLIERLWELDPDADAILALWQENDKFSD